MSQVWAGKPYAPVGSGRIKLGANRHTYAVRMPEGDSYPVFGFAAQYAREITIKQFELIGRHGIFRIWMPDGAAWLRVPLGKIPSLSGMHKATFLNFTSPDRKAAIMGKGWRAEIEFVERSGSEESGVVTYWKGFPGAAEIEILFLVANSPEAN